MRRLSIISTLLVIGLAAPAAQAHTLAFSTAIARLNRSITQTFNDNGIGIDERDFSCYRNSRHKVSCFFTLLFPDGDFTCGKGYVIDHGSYYNLRWRTRQYLCGE